MERRDCLVCPREIATLERIAGEKRSEFRVGASNLPGARFAGIRRGRGGGRGGAGEVLHGGSLVVLHRRPVEKAFERRGRRRRDGGKGRIRRWWSGKRVGERRGDIGWRKRRGKGEAEQSGNAQLSGG